MNQRGDKSLLDIENSRLWYQEMNGTIRPSIPEEINIEHIVPSINRGPGSTLGSNASIVHQDSNLGR